jgi:hypothetical protein
MGINTGSVGSLHDFFNQELQSSSPPAAFPYRKRSDPVARGTGSSNPFSSSAESGANLTLCGCELVRPRSFLTPWRLIVSEAGTWELAREAAALGFISNAFNHLKVIGYLPAAKPLLQRAGITDELVDAGVVKLDGANAIAGLIAATKKTRIWDREPKVRNVP